MGVSVLGSLNLDQVCAVPELPRPGMTVLASDFTHFAGGKGLNQAIAAARIGAATAMLGAVGDDAAGRFLLATLGAVGVATSGVAVRAGVASGQTHIAVAPSGENQIVVIPGANATVTGEEIDIALDDQVLLAQLELPVEAIAALFARAAGRARRAILNTAPAVPEGARLFALADMLIFNQVEFATYLQLDAEPEQAGDLLAVRRLLTRPDQAAVVTLGARGAAAVWADRTMTVEGFPADPIDTTGAGDCFCGTLAAALAQGMAMEPAMTLANAAAALSTMTRGAAAAMPDRARIEAFVKAQGRS